jgi:hypothetical protein
VHLGHAFDWRLAAPPSRHRTTGRTREPVMQEVVRMLDA